MPRQKWPPDSAAIRNRPATAIRVSSGAPSFSTKREIGSRITRSSAYATMVPMVDAASATPRASLWRPWRAIG